MFRNLIRVLFFGLIALAVPASASAGWMGFRNDTNLTLVVQEVVVVNKQVRTGKPQRLASGDVIRDSQVCPSGERRFSIYDLRNTKRPLLTDDFACPQGGENVLYTIRIDAKGQLSVESVKTTGLSKQK
jgi:hypothetical protein